MIRSVHKFGGLLRASVASATNDHRLGANEAPPAIISIFLGDQLADVFDQIAKGGATSSKEKGTLEIGVDTLPVLPTDPGDRNRTSPFAFTGNRFEFRGPRLAAVHRRTDGHDQHHPGRGPRLHRHRARDAGRRGHRVQRRGAEGARRRSSPTTAAVVFNGDGYADEWQIEAAERGLPNLRTTLDALPELITEESMELFSHYGVFNHREMHSRYEIALEQYILAVDVEAKLTLEMANTMVLPAGLRYQTELATNAGQPQGGRGRGRHHHARRGVGVHRRTPRPGIAALRSEIGARRQSIGPRSTPSTPGRGSCRP